MASVLKGLMKIKRNNHISSIMSKRHGIFFENFTIFFSNAEKTENVLEILEDHILVMIYM